ncbi:hypothetical protein H2201_008662 [Coniosporium apollinis]|uniref:Heterokaryon incompatibility domain-containing protein n=1 Tax=Coniosporium apollinis TaxID=61459 RepID=A0ABQ9NM88_9PEZI|nr:hypothetical protein H2201_008662 [Coniosporium apollinis]
MAEPDGRGNRAVDLTKVDWSRPQAREALRAASKFLEWQQEYPSMSAITLKPFQYKELRAGSEREIRLLKLLPGETDFIRVRIVHACLGGAPDTAPDYEALSYCWGNPTDERPIFLDQGLGQRWKLMVRENLFSALKRLRLRSKERTLWVDAVCINQADTPERNAQVAMMRDIYQKSRRVVIWLGEASETSDEALALIPKLNHAKELDSRENIEANLWAMEGDRGGLPDAHKKLWYDLFDVLKRDWFYRAWIVQELAVSPRATVLCGDVEFEWNSLVNAITYLVEAGGLGLTLGLNALQQLQILDYRRQRYQEGQSIDILPVLLQNRKALASNPRDHIFAFNGFFETGSFGHALTMATYEVDCNRIYIEVAQKLLRRYKNLDIFTIPRTGHSRLHGLPTWVPDWSAGDLTEAFLWRYIHPDFTPEQRAVYRASADSDYIPVFNEAGSKLKLYGWKVDEVNTTGPTYDCPSDHVILGDYKKMFRQVIREQKIFSSWDYVSGVFKMGSTCPTGEAPQDVYWQTLLGGCLYGFDMETMRYNYSLWHSSMLGFRVLQLLRLDRVWLLYTWMVLKGLFFWLFVGIFQFISLLRFLEVQPGDNTFARLATHWAYRRLMRTDEGLIGLAPSLTQPGDVVALCQGGKLPLILRRKGKDWELIGDCYVHGLMDGKLWEMLEGHIKAEGKLWKTYQGKCQRREFWLV